MASAANAANATAGTLAARVSAAAQAKGQPSPGAQPTSPNGAPAVALPSWQRSPMSSPKSLPKSLPKSSPKSSPVAPSAPLALRRASAAPGEPPTLRDALHAGEPDGMEIDERIQAMRCYLLPLYGSFEALAGEPNWTVARRHARNALKLFGAEMVGQLALGALFLFMLFAGGAVTSDGVAVALGLVFWALVIALYPVGLTIWLLLLRSARLTTPATLPQRALARPR